MSKLILVSLMLVSGIGVAVFLCLTLREPSVAIVVDASESSVVFKVRPIGTVDTISGLVVDSGENSAVLWRLTAKEWGIMELTVPYGRVPKEWRQDVPEGNKSPEQLRRGVEYRVCVVYNYNADGTPFIGSESRRFQIK